MSEKKDQLKEILKDQLNREAKQIEEEVGLNDNEEIPNELKIRMKNALDQKIREREMRSEDMKRTDAYAKLSEEDQEALRLVRELQTRRKEKQEEKSRAKERIFSFRNENHAWDPKNQRPEMWKLYNSKIQKGQEVRVFPLSNWTEKDIWQYIKRDNIDIPSLYFEK